MTESKKNRVEEKEKKRKPITLYISEDLDRVLSIEAAKKEIGRSKSDIVTIALENLFRQKQSKE